MRRRRFKKKLAVLAVIALLGIIVIGVLFENMEIKKEEEKKTVIMTPFLFREILYSIQPLYHFLARGGVSFTPLGKYCGDHAEVEDIKEYYLSLMKSENDAMIAGAAGEAAEEEKSEFDDKNVNGKDETGEEEWVGIPGEFFSAGDFLIAGSGFVSSVDFPVIARFERATEKVKTFTKESLRDYEFVMEHFYTVDASTSPVGMSDVKGLLAYDCTVDQSQEGPQILIYHTHSQEGFVDSVPEDTDTTIVGAGKYLAELLREEYGYSVYHHTGTYDVDSRDDAYAKTAPAIEAILTEYPQIQVVIDLHRDGVAENRRLVHEVQGINMAQFMFFNGLSYSNKKGTLDYLPNENLQANLALSLKLGIAANEYYPGLARTNYLNAYRYNMHYRDKTLLIELGAQTNTVEEIMNACAPLAHILDMVFSGQETYW